jgi:hypothetical protein
MFFQVSPEWLGFKFIQKRSILRSRPASFVLRFAHTAPKIRVECMHRLPPWPLTIPNAALGT